jgi:hypothetical protein
MADSLEPEWKGGSRQAPYAVVEALATDLEAIARALNGRARKASDRACCDRRLGPRGGWLRRGQDDSPYREEAGNVEPLAAWQRGPTGMDLSGEGDFRARMSRTSISTRFHGNRGRARRPGRRDGKR